MIGPPNAQLKDSNNAGVQFSSRICQAMEQQGKLLRIPDMDQDQYEMTAFSYRLEDRMRTAAPAFLVERTRMNGACMTRR